MKLMFAVQTTALILFHKNKVMRIKVNFTTIGTSLPYRVDRLNL